MNRPMCPPGARYQRTSEEPTAYRMLWTCCHGVTSSSSPPSRNTGQVMLRSSRRCSWEAPGVRSWRAVVFSFGFSSPGRRCSPMRERQRFFLVWAVVLGTGSVAVATLGRYGVHVVAFGLLYAALATSWSCMRAAGLFSFGQAAFFGTGALTQGWLVSAGRVSPWLALCASAAAGALAAVPLIPGLRLSPPGFGLATLAYAIFLKGLAGNAPAFGMEGFLLPKTPGFDGPAAPVVVTLALLVLAISLGYEAFLGRPSGRAAAALRQSPETTLSLGIDLVSARWRTLTLSAATTAIAGALYAHLVGSVETTVVFSSTFSVVPLVLGMLGGALQAFP